MKALLLNAGIGKRLKPFTDTNPKCLLNLNHETILEHELNHLLHYNIKDLIITTGPFEDKIKKLIKHKFPELRVSYVSNDKPEFTNYIYSIWLARNLLKDDILLMHGDMVFERGLLGRLLESKYPSCVLVNNSIKFPEKDFKVRIKDGIVREIKVNIFGDDVFFLAPIYKLSKMDIGLWLDEISKFVERNEVKVYAENAFNNISDKIMMRPIYYSNEFCMEIDNMEDAEVARKFFRSKISPK